MCLTNNLDHPQSPLFAPLCIANSVKNFLTSLLCSIGTRQYCYITMRLLQHMDLMKNAVLSLRILNAISYKIMDIGDFIRLLQTLVSCCKVFQLLQENVGCSASVKYMPDCSRSDSCLSMSFLEHKSLIFPKMTIF